MEPTTIEVNNEEDISYSIAIYFNASNIRKG